MMTIHCTLAFAVVLPLAAYAGTSQPPATTMPVSTNIIERPGVNQLRNSDFSRGLTSWRPWQFASRDSNWVQVVTKSGETAYCALRLMNPEPGCPMVGVQQEVRVVSGCVYRLVASAQSMVTNSSAVLFGGRVAFNCPPQPERQLVWTTEFNNWWRRKSEFTNTVTGTARVFVHIGYGNQPTTGEFADVRLERLGNGKP